MLFSTWKTFRAPKDWTPGHKTWWLGITLQKGKGKAFGHNIKERKAISRTYDINILILYRATSCHYKG